MRCVKPPARIAVNKSPPLLLASASFLPGRSWTSYSSLHSGFKVYQPIAYHLMNMCTNTEMVNYIVKIPLWYTMGGSEPIFLLETLGSWHIFAYKIWGSDIKKNTNTRFTVRKSTKKTQGSWPQAPCNSLPTQPQLLLCDPNMITSRHSQHVFHADHAACHHQYSYWSDHIYILLAWFPSHHAHFWLPKKKG